MSAPEFSRPVRIDTIGALSKPVHVEASTEERAALARRFGLAVIDRLTAMVSLSAEGSKVTATGTVSGAVTQSCVASSEPVQAVIEAPFELVFRPQPDASGPDEEIELAEAELDTIFHEGGAIDIGEAVAETLALNLNPYPRASEAEEALKAAGVKSEEEAGPFAALAKLRDRLKK